MSNILWLAFIIAQSVPYGCILYDCKKGIENKNSVAISDPDAVFDNVKLRSDNQCTPSVRTLNRQTLS